MKVGILMTIYNRPHLTWQSLISLANSGLPKDCVILLVDDASTDRETIAAFHEFSITNIPVLKIINEYNLGIKQVLKNGIELLFNYGCDVVTNLDNDVKLKPGWLQTLLELNKQFFNYIITGFHSITHNSDGTERHKIIESTNWYCSKESVGGINMMFNKSTYTHFILPALEMQTGNWDHQACILSMKNYAPIYCTIPSIIQHTGIQQSSMHHNELPDLAADFYTLTLPDVTLIGVDCNHFEELEFAALISTREIQFGAVKLLTSARTSNPYAVQIPHIGSKEEYNRFIMRELYKYVDTTHLITIQGDGYILNADAWREIFLYYDYIGATWVYKDGMNVGNGGFSLRSKQLMVATANNELRFSQTMPEDHCICRIYRKDLELMGFKFATEEVANRFSIEAYGCDKLLGSNHYSGQFGFHGWHTNFSNSDLSHKPEPPRNKLTGRRMHKIL